MAPIPSTHLRSITDYIVTNRTVSKINYTDETVLIDGGFPNTFTPATPQTLKYPEHQPELRMAAEGDAEGESRSWGHLAILHLKQLLLYQLVTTDEFRRADRNNRNQLLALSLLRSGAILRHPFPGVRGAMGSRVAGSGWQGQNTEKIENSIWAEGARHSS